MKYLNGKKHRPVSKDGGGGEVNQSIFLTKLNVEEEDRAPQHFTAWSLHISRCWGWRCLLLEDRLVFLTSSPYRPPGEPGGASPLFSSPQLLVLVGFLLLGCIGRPIREGLELIQLHGVV